MIFCHRYNQLFENKKSNKETQYNFSWGHFGHGSERDSVGHITPFTQSIEFSVCEIEFC